jgi:hypothetical protein
MRSDRRPVKDPRTVAREIPGLFDALFPTLKGGFVHALNSRAYACDRGIDIGAYAFDSVTMRLSLLFEVAVARAESLVAGEGDPDWGLCLSIAAERQRRHFDVRVPDELETSARDAADRVAQNLAAMLDELRNDWSESAIVVRPYVPGYEWIASSEGDFAIGSTLIEVKCIQGKFGPADYRQVLMYWLLSYASAIEINKNEWRHLALLNPRRNIVVRFDIDEIFGFITHNASKLEVLQLFVTLVEESSLNLLAGRG